MARILGNSLSGGGDNNSLPSLNISEGTLYTETATDGYPTHVVSSIQPYDNNYAFLQYTKASSSTSNTQYTGRINLSTMTMTPQYMSGSDFFTKVDNSYSVVYRPNNLWYNVTLGDSNAVINNTLNSNTVGALTIPPVLYNDTLYCIRDKLYSLNVDTFKNGTLEITTYPSDNSVQYTLGNPRFTSFGDGTLCLTNFYNIAMYVVYYPTPDNMMTYKSPNGLQHNSGSTYTSQAIKVDDIIYFMTLVQNTVSSNHSALSSTRILRESMRISSSLEHVNTMPVYCDTFGQTTYSQNVDQDVNAFPVLGKYFLIVRPMTYNTQGTNSQYSYSQYVFIRLYLYDPIENTMLAMSEYSMSSAKTYCYTQVNDSTVLFAINNVSNTAIRYLKIEVSE